MIAEELLVASVVRCDVPLLTARRRERRIVRRFRRLALLGLEKLNSTTAINVASMSRAVRDRLRSFGLRCRGMRGSVIRCTSAPMDIISSPLAP
jgi:hypothetical protein